MKTKTKTKQNRKTHTENEKERKKKEKHTRRQQTKKNSLNQHGSQKPITSFQLLTIKVKGKSLKALSAKAHMDAEHSSISNKSISSTSVSSKVLAFLQIQIVQRIEVAIQFHNTSHSIQSTAHCFLQHPSHAKTSFDEDELNPVKKSPPYIRDNFSCLSPKD